MDFVTSLLESSGMRVSDYSNLISDVSDFTSESVTDGVFGDVISNHTNEIGLGFCVEPLFTPYSYYPGVEMESRTASPGHRVVGIDSGSDSDLVVFNSEITVDVDDDYDIDGDDLDLSVFWDCLPFSERRTGNEEYDWEEVDEGDDGGEGPSSVTDGIDEISVSVETSLSQDNSGEIGEEEEATRNVGWTVLSAVNTFEGIDEFEDEEVGDGVSYLALQDDFSYDAEYEHVTLFGQLVENEIALKGNPPAAKLVVENLPSIVLTKEDLKENDVVCAVCKDGIMVDEMVTSLPCQHHYHGNCIVPWLSVRNTCPVCRYELPTDDAEYEQQKITTDDHGVLDGLQVRYNF